MLISLATEVSDSGFSMTELPSPSSYVDIFEEDAALSLLFDLLFFFRFLLSDFLRFFSSSTFSLSNRV